MTYSKFKNQLGSWAESLKGFIESKECDEIYEYLKKESSRGVTICPLSGNTYRAFKECPKDKLKCVIVTMDPYPWKKEGVLVADGIPMSCANTSTRQPSLDLFYEGIEDDLANGMNLFIDKVNDLSYLANQGVLLLNSSLTTELNVIGAHGDLWHPFHKYLFNNVIPKDIPIALLGKQAKELRKYMVDYKNIIEAEHPAAASYYSRKWKHNNIFSYIDNQTKGEKVKWVLENERENI